MPRYFEREYTHFQFIALEGITSKAVAPGEEPNVNEQVPDAQNPNQMKDLIPNNLGKDYRIRLKRMLGIILQAFKKTAMDLGDNEKTLKIFMAPEFYFRPLSSGVNDGDYGQPSNSYSHSAMIEIVTTLKEMFQDEDFKHWLFLPGTIFWSEKASWKGHDEAHQIHLATKEEEDIVYFNTSVIARGGAKDAPFFTIHKRSLSNVDGAQQVKAAKENKAWNWLFENTDILMDNVREIDHHWIGAEICMDHTFGVLKNEVLPRLEKTRKHGAPTISLHLLTACGKRIDPAHCVVKEGGYFLRVDGDPDMAGRATVVVPDYGTLPTGRSTLLRHVPDDQVPAQEQASVDTNGNKLGIWLSRRDNAGQDMMTPSWTVDLADPLALPLDADHWQMARNNANLRTRLVAYPRQPF